VSAPEDYDGYVAAAAAVMSLELSNESRAATAANLEILFARAAEFVDEPLDAAVDPVGLLRL
jgi:hypothetical protein